jgi:hypothetical protein
MALAQRVKRLAHRGYRGGPPPWIVAERHTAPAMRAPLMNKERKPGDLPGPPETDAAVKPHESLSEALARLYTTNSEIQEAPGGLGEFGHSRTNPVPTVSLEESRRYLSRIRLLGGERVVWTHSATIAFGLNGKPVFQYAILSPLGQPLATLYLSPGYDRTSTKAPRGFELEPEARS